MTATAGQWNARWLDANTPWDLQGVTPALIDWRRRHDVKGRRILVPGCGQGHDAHYLAKAGARVVAVDFAPEALAAARRAYPHSAVDWRTMDATRMSFPTAFDRVWEHTCFCALDPSQRDAYLDRVHRALEPGGVYWGLVFSSVPKPDSGPPFSIEPAAFERLLARFFGSAVELELETPRSIKTRRGSEIWFIAQK